MHPSPTRIRTVAAAVVPLLLAGLTLAAAQPATAAWVLQGAPTYSATGDVNVNIGPTPVVIGGYHHDVHYNGGGGAMAVASIVPLFQLPSDTQTEATAIANDTQLKARAQIGDDRRSAPFNAQGHAAAGTQVTRYWELQSAPWITSATIDLTLLLDGVMWTTPIAELVHAASASVDLTHRIVDFATGATLLNVYDLHADLSPLRPGVNDNLLLRESGVFSTLAPGETRTPWQKAFTDRCCDQDLPSDRIYDVGLLASRQVTLPTNTVLGFVYTMDARVDVDVGAAYGLYVASDFGHTAEFGFTLAPEFADTVTLVEYVSEPAPVPEPQTWAMLALGLAVTGGLARRRGLTPARPARPATPTP